MTDSDFNTPPWIIELVEQLDPNNGIGLDPCSNATSMVHATTTYDIVSNGLIHSWRGHGLVFMNPPHSMSPNNIEPWMDKLNEEFAVEEPSTDQFVGLIPAKTDPAWFHETIPQCAAVCFLRGRPKFWQNGVETKGPGKFASMLIYVGNKRAEFVRNLTPFGWIPQ